MTITNTTHSSSTTSTPAQSSLLGPNENGGEIGPRLLNDAELNCYKEHGYTIYRNAFTAEEVEAMSRFDVDYLLHMAKKDPTMKFRLQIKEREDGKQVVQKIEGLRSACPDMSKWSNDPRLLNIATQIMGEEAHLFKDKYILKPKGGGSFGCHQDMSFGFHRFTHGVVSMMIAIDKADDENGCLQVASVQHAPSLVSRAEMGLEKRLIPKNAWKHIHLNPGDVAIFDGLTPHRSEPNESEDRLRRVYITTYNPKADGDIYDDYYKWYFDWKEHQANGGQRNEYQGQDRRLSLQKIRSFTNQQSEVKYY